MISALISMILSILNFVIKLIIRLIMAIFPAFQLDGFALGISTFFDMLGNGVNLTYFIFGPMCFIYIDIIIVLLAIKLIVLPIIIFIRKAIIRIQ